MGLERLADISLGSARDDTNAQRRRAVGGAGSCLLQMPRRDVGTSKAGNRGSAKLSSAGLEAKREALVKRLSRLRPEQTKTSGYKSARVLLGSKYIKASRSARLAILQAAQFLITVLEMMPPF